MRLRKQKSTKSILDPYAFKNLNIKDEDFDYYLEEKHTNPLDNIYFIQYFITK